jgi:hypothetical protein
MRTPRLSKPEAHLLPSPQPGRFVAAELERLPEPARRHLAQAIAPGTPLVTSALLRMRGHIKVGRWLPFRAHQVLNPHSGFVWSARAAGIIVGSDRYLDGDGRLDWKLLGLLSVAHAKGRDVARSAAGRVGAEAIWLPTTLLPRFGVRWSAADGDQATAGFRVGDTPVELRLRLDAAGRIASLVFDRWGDPDNSGTFGWHRFGGEFTGYRNFQGLAIPSEGRLGLVLRRGPLASPRVLPLPDHSPGAGHRPIAGPWPVTGCGSGTVWSTRWCAWKAPPPPSSDSEAAAKNWPASGPLPWGSNDPERPLPVGRR